MEASASELSGMAREINNRIFGQGRTLRPDALIALKMQLDESAKFALQKTLSSQWISPSERESFLEVLKEQPDAVNLFIVGDAERHRSIEMIKPIFGYKSAKVLDLFRDSFNALQEAIEKDRMAQK